MTAPSEPVEIGSERPIENRVVIALAGPAAERRALRGSEPGWRRMLRLSQLIAHHEAGHAVIAAVLGQTPWELWIAPHPEVSVSTRMLLAGYSINGSGERPARPFDPSQDFEGTDLQVAAKYSLLLAPSLRWQAGLRIARRLRNRAEALVDRNWRLIQKVAAELEAKGHLEAEQIAQLLRLLKEKGESR